MMKFESQSFQSTYQLSGNIVAYQNSSNYSILAYI